MQAARASRTAEVMALFRTLESRSGRNRLFSDEFSQRFLTPPLSVLATLGAIPVANRLVADLLDRRWLGARTSAIARTRYIDDLVTAGLQRDAKQLIILGAGFDTRGARLPEAQKARVFEVDHPNTGQEKLRRLGGASAFPNSVRQVAVDFNTETPARALREAGADLHVRSIVLWEGVTQYLEASAVDLTLDFVARFPPGSELIFTYVDASALLRGRDFEGFEAIDRAVRRQGEPWTSGLHPADVCGYLRKHGLRLLSDLSASEYRVLYPRLARARGYEFYHVAHASVGNEAIS